ncbi:Clp protease ClpP [Flavobacterium facile]|uniref:Clp protease ClpP n=1 Tax=Flavobacterium facile TaxID=2893174 RepID=UPI002E78CDB6|nr:ATP-dependent Clp protease proteolytic subunit [Flavobacterium sp. T-12]
MKNTNEKILITGSGSLDLTPFIVAHLSEKFPLVIVAEKKGKTADIRITGALYEYNTSTEELTAKIDQFIADGIQDVNVYLNGPGGDVFIGAEIENQLQRFTGSKKGLGGALVASAYTKIAMSLDSFEMAENGQFMYHKPSGYFSGNEDKVESSLTLLKTLTTQYKETYAEKTGMTTDEIEAKWSKGDVWLTAKEAVAQKFITGVIKKATITPETKAMFEAFGSPNIPKLTSKKSNLNIMDKEKIALMLGLTSDASEAQIEAAIKANKVAAETVAALKQEKITADANALDQQIYALLNKAVSEKKIVATQVEGLKGWAKNDFKGCEAHINSLQSLVKISASVTGNSGKEGTLLKAFEDMTTAERDNLANEDPEAFTSAYTAYLAK